MRLVCKGRGSGKQGFMGFVLALSQVSHNESDGLKQTDYGSSVTVTSSYE